MVVEPADFRKVLLDAVPRARGVQKLGSRFDRWVWLVARYLALPYLRRSCVVWSFLYVVLCRQLQLVVLLGRSERSKELEILLLRHELAIVRRQSRRARLRPVDRAIFAALARALPRSALGSLSVRPATLLRWHRQLGQAALDLSAPGPGTAPFDRRQQALVLRLARENPAWGYRRIVGGCEASAPVFRRPQCGRSLSGTGCRRRRSETSSHGETSSGSRRRRHSAVTSSPSRRLG